MLHTDVHESWLFPAIHVHQLTLIMYWSIQSWKRLLAMAMAMAMAMPWKLVPALTTVTSGFAYLKTLTPNLGRYSQCPVSQYVLIQFSQYPFWYLVFSSTYPVV